MGSPVNVINSNKKAKNLLYNGGFGLFQRGPSQVGTVSSFFYTADRWGFFSGATSNYSINRTAHSNPAFALDQGRNAVIITRVAGNAAVTGYQFNQTLERRDSQLLVGKQLTLSFSAYKGSGYSAVGSVLQASILYTLANGDTNYISGWVSPVVAGSVNAVLTTGVQRFSVTATLPNSNIVGVAVNFLYVTTGVAPANDHFVLEDVMLEEGPVATEFETRGQTFAEELALCQRYFQRGFIGATGLTIGATTGYLMTAAHVQMRANPIFGINPDVGGTNAIDEVLISPRSVSAVGTLISSPTSFAITFTSAGMTANRFVRPNTDFFFANAEL